VLIYSVF